MVWYELSDEQKERFGSEAAMEKSNKQQTEGAIAWWKKRNIQWHMDSIKNAKLEKIKVEKKLDALANS